jgi:hypothetical protein
LVFHSTVFLYAPWSASTKMWVGFVSAAVYVSTAVAAFSFLFAPDKWLKIFHATKVMESLDGQAQAHEEHEEEFKRTANV